MAEFTNEKILPQSLEAEQAVLAAPPVPCWKPPASAFPPSTSAYAKEDGWQGRA